MEKNRQKAIGKNVNWQLFKTGFLYVFLLSANTLAIARLFWVGIAVFGFLISYLWTVNVRRVTVSTRANRLAYAMGAMLGGVAGVFIVNFFKNIIN